MEINECHITRSRNASRFAGYTLNIRINPIRVCGVFMKPKTIRPFQFHLPKKFINTFITFTKRGIKRFPLIRGINNYWG